MLISNPCQDHEFLWQAFQDHGIPSMDNAGLGTTVHDQGYLFHDCGKAYLKFAKIMAIAWAYYCVIDPPECTNVYAKLIFYSAKNLHGSSARIIHVTVNFYHVSECCMNRLSESSMQDPWIFLVFRNVCLDATCKFSLQSLAHNYSPLLV